MIKNEKLKRDVFFEAMVGNIKNYVVHKDYYNFCKNGLNIQIHDLNIVDYLSGNRIMSSEEEKVLEIEAFELLLFWVCNNEISIDFFEKFLTILVCYENVINIPFNKEDIVSLVEMVSMVECEDYAVLPALEIYLNSRFQKIRNDNKRSMNHLRDAI
jgi:hypothetical protein